MENLTLWELQDALSKDPEFTSRLSSVDRVLFQRDLIDRVCYLDRGMVMQLFYVRNWIVANPALPRKLRLSALDQLQATGDGLPDFILRADECIENETNERKARAIQSDDSFMRKLLPASFANIFI